MKSILNILNLNLGRFWDWFGRIWVWISKDMNFKSWKWISGKFGKAARPLGWLPCATGPVIGLTQPTAVRGSTPVKRLWRHPIGCYVFGEMVLGTARSDSTWGMVGLP
jgi:hypothetical protein